MTTSPADRNADARFTRRVGLVTAGTMISRLLGLARESVFAWLFGAGLAADAFNVAFRIPNFLRDLFAESALSAAFVPAFVRSLRRDGPDQAWRFAAAMLNVLTLAIGLLVIAGLAATPGLVRLVALGFAGQPEKLALTVQLTRVMLPFLLLVAWAAWAMGILNACGTFFVPAVAPGAFNIVSIAVPLATFGWLRGIGVDPIAGMAWGVTLGALVQFAVQLPGLRRHGFRWQPVLALARPELRRVLARWLPVVLGFASWQVSALVNTFLLTFLPEGSVTWVNYAYRIQHLPAGLFGVAISSVALAEYSHEAAGEAGAAIRARFRHAMGLVAALTIPAALLMLVLADPVVRLVYQHGRFTALDGRNVAQALALYCLGIWAAAAARNCAAGFYSLGNTRTPAVVAALAVSLNIALNLLLMRRLGFLSFPLATSLAQFCYLAALFALLRRRLGGLDGRALIALTLKVTAAAAGAAALAFGLARAWSLVPGSGLLWHRLGHPLLPAALGIAGYYLLSRLLGIGEVRAAFSQLFARKREIPGAGMASK
ncbi:MAG: murein biosynthesis integral membrane protein MurJ [bacterium]